MTLLITMSRQLPLTREFLTTLTLKRLTLGINMLFPPMQIHEVLISTPLPAFPAAESLHPVCHLSMLMHPEFRGKDAATLRTPEIRQRILGFWGVVGGGWETGGRFGGGVGGEVVEGEGAKGGELEVAFPTGKARARFR